MSGQNNETEIFKKKTYQIFIYFLAILFKAYYFLFKKDYYNRHHLEIVWADGNLKVSWFKHNDYVTLREAELNELLLESDPEEFISSALTEAKDCNFIIFDCGDEKRFVQFWLGDGELMVSWPVIKKTNKLDKYVYSMLGVLNELDITQRLTKVGGLIRTKYQYYEVKQESDFTDYQIHFANNIDEATKFTIAIFTHVFKQDLQKLRFKLG